MNVKIRQIAVLILSVGATVCAVADYPGGVAAYQQGNFERALQEWQQVLESSPADVHPQERAETLYAVAMLYWLGQGVPQDTATAAGFLQQAADLNHSGAQSKLGYLYLIGQGVAPSNFEAQKWLEMAARQGDADAQYNLAVMYRDGVGTEADSAKALRWFEEAASNGDPVSVEVVQEYRRRGSFEANTAFGQVSGESAVLADGSASHKLVDSDDAPATAPLPTTETATLPENAVIPTTTSADPQSELLPKVDVDLPQARTESWIASRDPMHYTIQVIALKNLQNMTRLIDAHPEMRPFAVYQQGEPEAPLYVLVQGDYVSLDEARSAQNKFPRSLAKPRQLWIRRFEMVQGLIEKRQAEYLSNEANRGTN